MPYLAYDNNGVVKFYGVPHKEDAERFLVGPHALAGIFYYKEKTETENYWYPNGVKTALQEFNPLGIRKKLALNEEVTISNLPEGTQIILRMTKIGVIGASKLFKWTPFAKGFYYFTLKKLGYKDKKFIIVVELAPKFRPTFSVTF